MVIASCCQVNELLQTTSLGVSVFTLVALSADRYLAISHPIWQRQIISTKRTLFIAGAIWLFAFLLAIPDGIMSTIDGYDVPVCSTAHKDWQDYTKYRILFRFIVYFAVPLTIIASFYALISRQLILSTRGIHSNDTIMSRSFHAPTANSTEDSSPTSRLRLSHGTSADLASPSTRHRGKEATNAKHRRSAPSVHETRKRVAVTVLVIVALFVACWLPRHVYLLWFYFDTEGSYNMAWHVFKVLGFCLMFLNSCINPLALYMVSAQFRYYYQLYLCHCNCVSSNSQRPLATNNHSYYANNRHVKPATAGVTCGARHQSADRIALYQLGNNGQCRKDSSDLLTEDWNGKKVSRLNSNSSNQRTSCTSLQTEML